MKTNDIKKGAEIMLRNGWRAIIRDNARGNIRIAEVFGFETETGSIYSHDIVAVLTFPHGDKASGCWVKVEHTDKQDLLRRNVERLARNS